MRFQQKSANACATTIGDKIRITLEKKPIPLLTPLHSKFFCSQLQVVRTAAQHYMEGVRERKLYFLFFKLEKC